MEIGHLLFLPSLSQAEVKTGFHHCMSLVYVGGNLGTYFFFFSHSKDGGGRKRTTRYPSTGFLELLNPEVVSSLSALGILTSAMCSHCLLL